MTMTTGTRDHAAHGTSTEYGERWQDQAICAQCPVAPTCRRESTQERFGIWGGLTEEERRWERGWSKR